MAVLEREVEQEQSVAEPVAVAEVEPTEQISQALTVAEVEPTEQISPRVTVAKEQQVESQPVIPILNSVKLVGRVGADPEIRFFESGAMKTTLSLAVNRPVKNSNPDWFTVELWDKNAEVAGDYVRKGSQIGIEGRLEINTWKDPQGKERSRPIIKADKLHLLSRPSSSSTQTGSSDSEL